MYISSLHTHATHGGSRVSPSYFQLIQRIGAKGLQWWELLLGRGLPQFAEGANGAN